MNLYLFNPDTDLALASRNNHYTPKANVCQMQRDLAVLPIWYAESGGAVLIDSDTDVGFLQEVKQLFLIDVQAVGPAALPQCDWQVKPWGWNLSLRNRLLAMGVDECCLPTAGRLEQYRVLSSRLRLPALLQHLRKCPSCCGESHNLHSVDACKDYVETQAEGAVLKAPWSSSGKGLLWTRGAFTPDVAGWCRNMLEEQGGIAASPIYNKVADFAMEFHADDMDGVRFVGYSLFKTNEKGAYQGNLLMSDERMEEYLCRYVPMETLEAVRHLLQQQLSHDAYEGYLGVDMMVCRQGDTYLLHPCVEMNLRMNMGVLAHCFAHRFLAPTQTADFTVKGFRTSCELHAFCDEARAAHPPIIRDGRLHSGFLALNPVTTDTRFLASVVAG